MIKVFYNCNTQILALPNVELQHIEDKVQKKLCGPKVVFLLNSNITTQMSFTECV